MQSFGLRECTAQENATDSSHTIAGTRRLRQRINSLIARLKSLPRTVRQLKSEPKVIP